MKIMTTVEERRALLRQRRENRANAAGGGGAGVASPSASNRRGVANQNLGDKPLQESVYSTSLRVLGHNSTGQVIFTTSHLPSLGLTSLQPLAQLGSQLQRIILDNNALESLEDLRFCHSLVHLSVSGNKLEQEKVFKYLTPSANSLNYLDLSNNKLTSLSGIEKLRFLVTVLVDKNQLTTLEVESSEDALRASANEHCGEHTAKLLDDIISAIDETIVSEKGRRSRRNSLTENIMNSRNQSMRMSISGVGGVQKSGSLSGSKSVSFGTDKNDENSSSGALNAEMTSPLRFLVSLWRFSASDNELKNMNPRVFERCPLRLLNLSNNALTNLDCVLPLHKTLMVLIVDNNEISHLPASASSGGLRRAGSRHLADVPHPSKIATHPDVSHLNFQMMSRLVSLNLGQNNIASFQEVAELKSLPQLRHLTLSNCTLCSLPTHTDIAVREKGLEKVKLDTVRCDNGGGSSSHPKSGGSTGMTKPLSVDESSLGDTMESLAATQNTLFASSGAPASGGGGIGRKKSSVIITSPSMTYDPDAEANSFANQASSSSQSFAVEALIRPDDSEQVTLRTPEEQDQAEFNKRTTEERYRLRILQLVPQLQTLDGITCSTEDIAEAQQLAGGHLREERTKAITKYIKPTSGAAGSALRKLVNRQKDDDYEEDGTTNNDEEEEDY